MREFDLNGLRLAEYQAKLFEQSAKKLECSTAIFLRRFMYSELLVSLDVNESSLISLNIDDGLKSIEDEFGKTSYGKEKYSSESLFWIGYLYRYISYTRNVGTPFLMKLFNHKQLNELYYVYHTQDLEWCIQNLLELNNLSESVFDRNCRLREVIKSDYIINNKK